MATTLRGSPSYRRTPSAPTWMPLVSKGLSTTFCCCTSLPWFERARPAEPFCARWLRAPPTGRASGGELLDVDDLQQAPDRGLVGEVQRLQFRARLHVRDELVGGVLRDGGRARRRPLHALERRTGPAAGEDAVQPRPPVGVGAGRAQDD